MDDTALLPYLAGCIDCDGYITISSRYRKRRSDGSPVTYFVAVVGLGQVTHQVPALLAERFGGGVCKYLYKDRELSLPAFMWQISNTQAAHACSLLRPYLQIKARQADLIQELAALPRTTPGQRMTAEQLAARQAIRDTVVALNSPGRRKHRATPSPEVLLATD